MNIFKLIKLSRGDKMCVCEGRNTYNGIPGYDRIVGNRSSCMCECCVVRVRESGGAEAAVDDGLLGVRVGKRRRRERRVGGEGRARIGGGK